jgi:hypothetical protein
MADVSFDLVSAPGEPVLLLVMLQGPEWVLSFRATPGELDTLRWIREAGRAGHPALRVGEAVGAAVHWAVDGDAATVMVGESAEAWDFAVTVQLTDIDRIVNEAAAFRPQYPPALYQPQQYPPPGHPQPHPAGAHLPQAYLPQPHPQPPYPAESYPPEPPGPR